MKLHRHYEVLNEFKNHHPVLFQTITNFPLKLTNQYLRILLATAKLGLKEH